MKIIATDCIHNTGAARFLSVGGHNLTPEISFEPQRGEENCFGLLGGSGGMLPWKIFKIKGPRLAKNAFPEISSRKNWIKMSQHVALLFNLGVLKTDLFAGIGGGGGGAIAPPLATAL